MNLLSGFAKSAYFTYLFLDLTAIGLTAFILTRVRSIMGGTKQRIAFFGVLVTFIIFLCLDISWNMGYHGRLTMSAFTLADIESWTFLFAVLIAYFWALYVEARCDIHWSHPRLLAYLQIIPVAVLLFLTTTTPMTGSLYQTLPNGTVGHGPYYWISVLNGFIYLVYAWVIAFLAAFRNRHRVRVTQYLTLLAFIFPPVMGLILDSIVKGTPIFAICTFASIFFVFVNAQEGQVNQDALTGLNNRRRAMEYLETNVSRISDENPMIVFMLDADYFKEINDRYGHNAGDQALCLIAEALRMTVSNTQVLTARLGGDEFLIAGFRTQVNDPEVRIQQIRDNLARLHEAQHIPYPISLSIGYAEISIPSQSIPSMIAEADASLYEDKKRTHTQANPA